jgi:anti-sigma regulatory factor (Ser/Thr protein kinase)
VLTALVVLPGRASCVPPARHFVESVLTAWGHPDSAWTGALLVSELAANAALHARTEFSVRVKDLGDRIRLEVSDSSPRIPRQRMYGADATTGRGLQLVAQLAHDWGVAAQADGKTVWVELPAVPDPGAEAAVHDIDPESLLASFPDESPHGAVADPTSAG